MFCENCGNKLDENACVCLNCGILVKNNYVNKVIKHKKKIKINYKVLGVVSTIFGIISIVFSLMLFFHDISSVGMYTEFFERFKFTLNYSITSIMISSVTLIFSLISKKSYYGKIGFYLSLLSFFFIITEFIVVIIY